MQGKSIKKPFIHIANEKVLTFNRLKPRIRGLCNIIF